MLAPLSIRHYRHDLMLACPLAELKTSLVGCGNLSLPSLQYSLRFSARPIGSRGSSKWNALNWMHSAMSSAGHDRACLPVILLKTRSPAGDAYEDLFSAPPQGGRDQRFLPRFVPVLQHRFEDEGLGRVRGLLQGRKISHSEDASFGGLIFTSQRAVEAFTQVVQESEGIEAWPLVPLTRLT